MHSNFPFQLLLPILRLLLCLQWSIWFDWFSLIVWLCSGRGSFYSKTGKWPYWGLCVYHVYIVFLNAIVFNFNQSHMDITELLWCWRRISHFPKLLHLFNCVTCVRIISHCQKHFVINAFFITIFNAQNRNIVPLRFLLSMVRAGHKKIRVWTSIFLSYVVAKSLPCKTSGQNCPWQTKGENVLSTGSAIVSYSLSILWLLPILPVQAYRHQFCSQKKFMLYILYLYFRMERLCLVGRV